ncbi:MAG: hypothetical protein QGG40_11285, partial [Myxococcota bacterium]|nr:hypothetical protein [Myxococcota bacterium]
MFALGTLAVLAGFWSPVAQAVPDDFDLDLEGYYRNRSYSFRDLYDGQEEAGRYMLQRLRVEPVIDFEGRAKFITQVDLLDDVTWGDNQSDSSTALFAGSPNSTSL